MSVEGDTTLPADGFTTVRLRAHVGDVSERSRIVLFVTTAGLLRVGGISTTDSLHIPTDSNGDAWATLVAPSIPADASIFASVEGVRPELAQQARVRFRAATVEDIVRFVTVPDTVRASEISGALIEVEIAAELENEDRRVEFTTTRGTFEFATAAGGQTRHVLAGDDHRARVTLMNPDEPGEGLVTVTVRGFTQEQGIHFLSDPTVSFTEAPTTAPADGFTMTQFEARIAGASAADRERTIQFRTTAGTLVYGSTEGRTVSVLADGADAASVFLRSPNEAAVAVVTAELSGATDERAIRFEVAPPDSIFVTIEADKFRLAADGQTQVTALLARLPGRGIVTRGLDVSFSAADSSGNAIPLARFFNRNPADAEGMATAIFTPDGTDYRGLVQIEATWSGTDGTVTGVTNLRIVDE